MEIRKKRYLLIENWGHEGLYISVSKSKKELKDRIQYSDGFFPLILYEIVKEIPMNVKRSKITRQIKKNSIIEIPELDMKIKYLGWRR